MFDFKVCTVCFTTDVKLFNMNLGALRHAYNTISGLQSYHGDGMPSFLCVECSGYIKRFIKFRKKCQRAHFALKDILQKNKEIKKSHLEEFDCSKIDIAPTLSYLDLKTWHYEEVQFRWVKNNRLSVGKTGIIPIAHYTTIKKEDKFESTNTLDIKTEDEAQSIDIASTSHNQIDGTYEVPIETDITDDFDNEGLDDNAEQNDTNNKVQVLCKIDKVTGNDSKADGSKIDVEYADVYPISMKEAEAAVEISKMFAQGGHRCNVCQKAYHNANRLEVHMRMHDQHISGNYQCDICKYHYRTDFLLHTHMTEKHLYKYVCKECSEVTFDRATAKQHYIFNHLQKRSKKKGEWSQVRPKWLDPRGGKRVKGSGSSLKWAKEARKIEKPKDYPIYTPLRQEEQYQLVLDRRNTRNYIDSLYKCELCFKGFRVSDTFSKHLKKHDPEFAGPAQCDMCKLHFKNARHMYKHMISMHLFKYSCQLCDYVCYNKSQALMHYRWHKNVTYRCPHCDKEFKKISTQLTHIRIKHPSTIICTLCGHSFVSELGLYYHKRISHSKEEVVESSAAKADTSSPFYCADCDVQFVNQSAFDTHLGSSKKHAVTQSVRIPQPPKSGDKKRGRPRRAGTSDIINNGQMTATRCEICNMSLENDVQTRKHYETEHPGTDYLKRYMCDVCGHVTKQYANLMVHMRTHTNEKPYECPHCDRKFSMVSNRDRHIVVHTGEKRYECQHCNRRFTQSSAVKLHIQTVHLKIPYAPWDKKNRKRRKELEGTSAPVSAVNAVTDMCLQPPQHKLILDTQGDYLNAYINYNDE